MCKPRTVDTVLMFSNVRNNLRQTKIETCYEDRTDCIVLFEIFKLEGREDRLI